MIYSSVFSWSFLGASLLMCMAMMSQYQNNWELTIRDVFGASIILALLFSTVMTLAGRSHVFSRALTSMTRGPISTSRVEAVFSVLSSRMGVSRVSLYEARLGTAFSVSLNSRGIVAISPDLVASMTPDEAEAVIAHELSHIRNGDSVAKGIARLAKIAFPFDPVLRLIEAATHRERELWADRVAIEFTRKPLALASALVKASSRPKLESPRLTAGLFVGGSGHGLLSFYPNLEKRVDALLALARRMEVTSSPLVA